MQTHQLQSLPFYSDTVSLIDVDGEPYVPMRPICENIGLAWQPQHVKLVDENSRWTVTMIVTVAQDGRQREMVCIPLRKVHGWLMTVSAKKVAIGTRPKLIRYQNECDEVLWNYWTKGIALNNRDMAKYVLIERDELDELRKARIMQLEGKGRGPVKPAESARMKEEILSGKGPTAVAKIFNRAVSTVRRHTTDEREKMGFKSGDSRQLSLFPGKA